MKISFIIPSHNCVAWLPHAVKSVLAQTHKDIECVIVDDGSTDTTAQYLKWLKDDRVKVVTNAKPRGRSVARNQGNAVATGDVLCVLDADDLAVPNRAKWMVDKFKQGCEFVYGSAVTISPVGENLGELRADVFNLEKAVAAKSNGIVHSTVAYTPKIASEFPYRDGLVSELGIDDWAQQIEFAISGHSFGVSPKVLSAYRVLSTAISGNRDLSKVSEAKDEFLKNLRVTA